MRRCYSTGSLQRGRFNNIRRASLAFGIVLVGALSAGSWALLNPNFTPLDVHRGAAQILSVKAQNPDPKAK